jgi:hypothetical protein
MKNVLQVFILFFSSIASAGFDCEAIKVIGGNDQDVAESIEISIPLSDSPFHPYLKVAEFEGLKFEARHMPESPMVEQFVSVSIRKGLESFTSNGTTSANVAYQKFNQQEQITTLYGISCAEQN